MPAFSNAFRLLVVFVVVCGGCYDNDSDQAGEAVVDPRVAGVKDIEAEKNTAERTPMSRDEFVSYVANETVGSPEDGFILFLKIPGKLSPEQRSEKYTGPIGEALEAAELGEVISAAAMMGAKPFAGVSVEVSDLEQGIDVIVEVLRTAGAPEGTEIRYGEGEKKFMELKRR